MKQLFFTTAAIAIPGAILLWIVWLFVKGVYSVASDWQLERELKQIRSESKLRRQPDQSSTSKSHSNKGSAPAEPVSFSLDAATKPPQPETPNETPNETNPPDV